MPMTVEVENLGEVLRMWRERSGLKLRGVADRASELLPGTETVSHTTIGRYEGGFFPSDGPNPAYLVAITVALGHKMKELPEEYRECGSALVDLIVRNRSTSRKAQVAA